MALILDSVAVGASQANATELGVEWDSNGGYLAVAQNDVYVQLGVKPQGVRDVQYTDPLHVPVGNVQLYPGTVAIRVWNYVAANQALVSAGIFSRSEATLTLASGGVSSPVNNIAVQHNGVLVGTEAALDFVDPFSFPVSVVDDGPNSRVVITPPSGVRRLIAQQNGGTVTNTAAFTSLLGGGMTIPANALGAGNGGRAVMVVVGTIQQATGAPQNLPAFRVAYPAGGVHIDTGAIGAGGGVASSGNFWGYRALIELQVIAAGVLQCNLSMMGTAATGVALDTGGTVTTGQGAWRARENFWWVEANTGSLFGVDLAAAITLDFLVANAVASVNYSTFMNFATLEVEGF